MAITRQLIFAITPGENGRRDECFSLAFGDVADGNSSGEAFTCGVMPPSKGSGISIMQETVFLGTTSGAALTFQAFKDTLALDGSTAIRGRAITHRIDPDARADSSARRSVTQKEYENLNFNGTSPMERGATIQYCRDTYPLRDATVEWNPFGGSSTDTLLSFEKRLANWVNIKIEDSSTSVGVPLLPPFSIEYISDGEEREGADS